MWGGGFPIYIISLDGEKMILNFWPQTYARSTLKSCLTWLVGQAKDSCAQFPNVDGGTECKQTAIVVWFIKDDSLRWGVRTII